MQRNYQKELEIILNDNSTAKKRPTLLLHSCCAPCSSYVLEFLLKYFDITVYYYNPNISPESEYIHRISEQNRIIDIMNTQSDQMGGNDIFIKSIDGIYDHALYNEKIAGLENEPEGGPRCRACFLLRLDATARKAAELHFDFFTTTLTVSPHKNACILNEIGEQVGQEYGVRFLPSDFKKKDGYKRSIELSGKYDLYRQSYCGCIYSIKK